MRYGSVCSGIEAATAAWNPLGWEPVFYSEIEPFPCAVLRHHYPDVPNYGDMTKYKEWPDASIDVLVGGTPCQSFSVAGLRKGLADPRGNLMLTFGAIAERFKPTWIVWENVPGVLSSNKGRDFGTFLGVLEELGYGFAYRVLDAQYFGVAQRRRRVFVVGYLGDWRRAAAVLFEPESLSGHPAPSREKGQRVAPTVSQGPTFSRTGNERVECEAVVPVSMRESGHGYWVEDSIAGTIDANMGCSGHSNRPATIAAAFKPGQGAASRSIGYAEELAPTLGSEAGVPAVAFAHGSRGVSGSQTLLSGYIQPVCIRTANTGANGHGLANDVSHTIDQAQGQSVAFIKGDNNGSTQETNAGALLRILRKEVGEEAFTKWVLGILDSLQPKEILRQALHGIGIRPASFSRDWMVYCSLSREKGDPSWILQSLRETECEGCPPQGWEPSEQLSRKLRTYLSELSQPGTQAQRFMRDLWGASEGPGILREALSAIQEMGRSSRSEGQPVCSMQVRRLTATECEFLQGFPRNYTLIPYRNKPAADGPRYKALGNSMAVPVMRWIGERIQLIESMEWTA